MCNIVAVEQRRLYRGLKCKTRNNSHRNHVCRTFGRWDFGPSA